MGGALSYLALWKNWYAAGAFSSNSFVNTMDMTAAIQYILTAAQSLGSQVYHKKSRMTILGLARTHRQNGLSYVPKKILTWGREGKRS